MNMLSNMTSFFASPGIEDSIDTEVLDQFEKKLAKLHKFSGDIEKISPLKSNILNKYGLQFKTMLKHNMNKL